MTILKSSNKRTSLKSGQFALTDIPTDHCFNGIDLIKFFCAFLVFIIHIPPFLNDSFPYANRVNFGLQNCICRIAVPFYFASSGFLLFRKINLQNMDTDRIRKYCFKILRLLGTWTFLLFIGSNVQLWYLGALVVAVIFLSLLLKYHIKLRYIILLSIILYIIGLLGDSYYGVIEPLKNIKIFDYIISGYDYLFSTTRNGVFMGLIFILIGVLYAHKKIVLTLKTAFIGFIISMLLLTAEVFVIKSFSNPKDFNMYVFLIPATFFLFHIATHINLKNRAIYGKLRVIGMLIFYSHIFIMEITKLLFKIISRLFGINLSNFKFIVTLILVTAFAILVEQLSHKDKFKWLTYLYS